MIQKNLLKLSVLAVLLIGGMQMQAQKFVLKINPLSLAAITANIQGEYAFNEKMSGQLGFFIGSVGLGVGSGGADGNVQYTWFGITPEFRYYAQNAKKDAPRGLYIAPFLRYRNVSFDYSASVYDPDINANVTGTVDVGVSAIGGGVTLGYQFLFGDVFALDMFLGPQYSRATTNASVTCTNCDGDEDIGEVAGISFGGIGLRGGIAIGVAF